LIRFHALATTVALFSCVGNAGAQTEESSVYKCIFDAAYNTLSGAAPVRSKGLESMYVGHRVDFAFSRLPTATVTTDINSATMEPMDFVVHQRGGKSNGWVLYRRVGSDGEQHFCAPWVLRLQRDAK
jgi:hypothetical protein